jgi:hypothetical protein
MPTPGTSHSSLQPQPGPRPCTVGEHGPNARPVAAAAVAAIASARGAIHQLLNIILKLRILVFFPVSTLPYVVIVYNYFLIGE